MDEVWKALAHCLVQGMQIVKVIIICAAVLLVVYLLGMFILVGGVILK